MECYRHKNNAICSLHQLTLTVALWRHSKIHKQSQMRVAVQLFASFHPKKEPERLYNTLSSQNKRLGMQTEAFRDE